MMCLITLALSGTASVARAAWVPFPVCQAPSTQYGETGVPDGNGGAIVAWFDARSGLLAVFVQHVLASDAVDPAWPVGGLQVAGAGADNVIAIASDGAGGAIVALSRTANSDIYAYHVLASGALDGSWPAGGVIVCSAPDNQISPVAVADGAGGAFLTWVDSRNAGVSGKDVYAHRVRSTGIVDPAWPVNGAAVCTQPGDQTSPVAVADGSGGIVIAWQDNRSATNFDVYAQRLLSTGAVATGWPAGGLQLVADPGNQTAPRIATDGAAGAIVAWADDRNGVDSDIYAMRARGTGTLGQGWHHDGEVICNAAGDQQPFSFIADGAGGAVAAWQDPRSADGTSDIYAQKIVSSGAKSWTTNGVAVCTAPNYQSAPALASDAAGGVYLAWLDRRFESGTPSVDLFVHHVTAAGAQDPNWIVNGVRATFDGQVGSNQGFNPLLLATGSGKATAAWSSLTANSYDVFALNLVPAPSPLYLLSVSATPPGTGTATQAPNQIAYPSGSMVTVTANPTAGCTFVNWSGDAGGSANPLALTMNATKNITANFLGYVLNAAVTPAGGGTVSRNPDQSSYAPGTSVTLTATPAAGHTFTGWSGDVISATNPLTITMDAPKNMVANLPPGFDGAWSPIGPPMRAQHSTILDPIRNRMLVFGGFDATTDAGGNALFHNDVWQVPLSGTPTCTLLQTAGTAPNLGSGFYNSPALVYDSARDRILVLNRPSNGPNTSVYALSLTGTPTWSLLTSAPVNILGAAYVVGEDRVAVLSDTPGSLWSLNLGGTPTWTETPTTGDFPTSMNAGMSVVYISDNNLLLLYNGPGTQREAWTLSLTATPTWVRFSPPGSPFPPSARTGISATYDPVANRAILFGGSRFDEVWELSFAPGGVWGQIVPSAPGPAGRSSSSIIYDPTMNRIVAFGGYSGASGVEILNDYWSLSLSASPSWTSLTSPSVPPHPRRSHTSFYDPIRRRVGIFGGEAGTNTLYDAWTQSTSSFPDWIQIPTGGIAPAVLGNFSGVFDPERDRLLVWRNGTNEIWQLPLDGASTWTLLATGGTPPAAQTGSSLVYDPLRDRLVLFGSCYDVCGPSDAYELSLGTDPATWAPLNSINRPRPRAGNSATYDPLRDRMIVIGGDNTSQSQDRWEVLSLSFSNPPTWTHLPDVPPEAGFWNHTAIYDPARDRIVVFGSGASNGTNDVWALSLAPTPLWIHLSPTGNLPTRRYSMSGTYDPSTDRMLIYGGFTQAQYFLSDEWSLTWGQPIAPLASCPGATSAAPSDVVNSTYAISNPSSSSRTYTYRLVAQRSWPGLPIDGSLVVAPNSNANVPLSFTVPDSAKSGHVRLRFRSWIPLQPYVGSACDQDLQINSPVAVDPKGPSFQLSLEGARPNPSTSGALMIGFTLAGREPARLELWDIAGRLIESRQIPEPGPGHQTLRLGQRRRLAAGMYMIRLTQGQRSRSARALVIN
jgi:hypothetical protein